MIYDYLANYPRINCWSLRVYNLKRRNLFWWKPAQLTPWVASWFQRSNRLCQPFQPGVWTGRNVRDMIQGPAMSMYAHTCVTFPDIYSTAHSEKSRRSLAMALRWGMGTTKKMSSTIFFFCISRAFAYLDISAIFTSVVIRASDQRGLDEARRLATLICDPLRDVRDSENPRCVFAHQDQFTFANCATWKIRWRAKIPSAKRGTNPWSWQERTS